MTETLRVTNSAIAGGYTFPYQATVSADGSVIKTPTVTAANVGQLTTRTSDTVGTLTMNAGHGITTGQRLDMYWAGGSRRGIVVGTVSVNSVPFTGGLGTVLPANLTAITAKVPQEEPFTVTGSDVAAIALYSDQPGQIVFATSGDVEVAAFSVGATTSSGAQSYVWPSGDGLANPLTGGAIAKVYFSHGTANASASMRAIVLNA